MFREISADCYLIVDGDDTYSAEHAKEMADYILSNKYDMVIGDRLSSTYFTENKRRFHNYGNILVKNLVNILFNGRVNDIMTGYRSFSANFVKSFPVISKGFEIETEMTIHALDKNFCMKSIPVIYRDRPAGSISKLNTITDGFKVIMTIFKLLKNYKPLLLFGVIALFMALVSIILFIPVLIEFEKTGLVLRFPTLIVSGFSMIGAIQLFSCGLILDVESKYSRQNFEIQMNIIEMIKSN